MHAGDLLILSDGRGDGIHRYFVKRAKESATIAMVTGLPEGALARDYADALFVHATVSG